MSGSNASEASPRPADPCLEMGVVRTRNPAQEAYEEAVKTFNEKLTRDEFKQIWLRGKANMEQVLQAVLLAKEKYDARSQQSKARKWITKFSKLVTHYSSIMDTLSNHHPEYVSLAWGAMKFLLMVPMPIKDIPEPMTLTQIALALPRANVKMLLWPTPQIIGAVSELFAYIIKFLQGAISWYSEGRLKHMITAVFRPMPLRFQDLLEEISTCSRTIDQLAETESQTTQKEMHFLLLEIKRTMIENQAANSRLFLDSRRRTCEIQFSQILTFTATTSLPNPEDSFRHSLFLSKRRRLRNNAGPHSSWHSHRLKTWASSDQSSLLMVKGSCLSRHETKDFVSDLVALLRGMKIPVVWTLNAKSESFEWRSPVGVLKQLVFQVLQLNHWLLSEQSISLNAAQFQSAVTEADWFKLLGLVLTGLQNIYVVVDAEILSKEFSSDLFWPGAFLKLFDDPKARNCDAVVKVVLISFGASTSMSSSDNALVEDVTIKIDRQRRAGNVVMRRQSARVAHHRQSSEALRPFLFRPDSRGSQFE
ncbi:uncharacterized protein PAC_02864 [Phialocephala subalpina]|uniref:DUF7708 domain-containing protein n=1 Tax=Phialocephala subalpina TaxID=576137 RepID=A0A1L7WJN3_9HELO|nr:uncharacterized protein PAC_02864 [Phialocephala subalpina]